MFFTVSVASKIVERKFVLQSDRRAAAKRKNAPVVQREAFVPLAEQLAKLHQQEEENLGAVMTFAPHKHEATKHVTVADAVAPIKGFRSAAASRAAAQGGAIGVPMIPKTALTRPEEFDFATAARELAKEGTTRIAGVDIFEEAEGNVRATENKIGMYVDLDGDLDQETVVAKRATTGKKRNPGRSRLAMMEDGAMAQPDFEQAEVLPKEVDKARQPQLTVPKTPKFATANRSRRRPLETIASSSRISRKREILVQEVNPAPQKKAAVPLTVPRSPQFATSKRFNRP